MSDNTVRGGHTDLRQRGLTRLVIDRKLQRALELATLIRMTATGSIPVDGARDRWRRDTYAVVGDDCGERYDVHARGVAVRVRGHCVAMRKLAVMISWSRHLGERDGPHSRCVAHFYPRCVSVDVDGACVARAGRCCGIVRQRRRHSLFSAGVTQVCSSPPGEEDAEMRMGKNRESGRRGQGEMKDGIDCICSAY